MRRPRAAWGVLGALVATMTGCWVIAGLEDRPVNDEGEPDATTPSDAGASGDADADPVVTTPDGATCRCLPPVPDGWDGPLVVDELADCAAPWNAKTELLHAGLDAGAHDCACTCASPATACLGRLDYMASCGTGACGGDLPMTPGACTFKGTSCASYLKVTRDGGGPCAPNPRTHIETPGWAIDARICHGPTVAAACDRAGPCVPDRPATAGYCIGHAGTLPCPPDYPMQRTYYDRADDARSCTPCTCSDGGAACEVGFYPDQSCNEGARIVTQYPGLCWQTPNSGTYYELVRGTAGCVANGGAKDGGVTTVGARTVCCRG